MWILIWPTLRKKCLYPELFWSAFSRIRSISPYSVRKRENTDQNNSEYWRLITLKRRCVSTVKELSQFQLFPNWNIQSCQEICFSQGLREHTTPCCLPLLKEILFLLINPFHATDLFWYPLRTSENLWFSDVFREYQKRSVA